MRRVRRRRAGRSLSQVNHAHSRSLIRLLRQSGKPAGDRLQICEVGVLEAANAEHLAFYFPDAILWLIDPYAVVNNPAVNGEIGTWNQEQFSGCMLKGIGRMRDFADRVRWIFSSDAQVVGQFPDGFFDLVFLDHLHDAPSMQRSLPLWLPKVAAGGIFAGHDYDSKMDCGGFYGVKSSVDPFFAARRMPVIVAGGHVWAVRLPLAQNN